jgi:glycosyltransferase involved in cell wall biosynthesis
MRVVLVTDAWIPQVNGVVTTLVELVDAVRLRGHEVLVVHPGLFRTRPCPGYPGIEIALWPGRRLRELITGFAPDAVHIATEGPLGWAARRMCLQRGWGFTTAFHTRFPEILHAALRIPLSWGYALFRRFHSASAGVLVPTNAVRRLLHDKGFAHLVPWTHGVDTQLFAFHEKPSRSVPALQGLARPISLFVGRVSYEKNIAAFLNMDIPGSKVVCGVGPLLEDLQQRYPQVHWLGVLPREELAQVYAAADVFVFPSRSETFGLVMLESMACGTPVAAYPVDGPTEVVGDDQGGALREDLDEAWSAAIASPRHTARARSLLFGWSAAVDGFVSALVPVRARQASQDACAEPVERHVSVTKPAATGSIIDT